MKKSLCHPIEEIECKHDNMVILKFQKMDFDILILVCIYVPPMDSPYYMDKHVKCNILFLEDELIRLHELYPQANIVICGDLNARTGTWNLHGECEDTTDEDSAFQNNCLCLDVIAHRSSQDPSTNRFGDILISLCKIFHLCILNGSVKGDQKGNLTYLSHQGDSVVDYCLLHLNNPHLDYRM